MNQISKKYRLNVNDILGERSNRLQDRVEAFVDKGQRTLMKETKVMGMRRALPPY